jgi:integrase
MDAGKALPSYLTDEHTFEEAYQHFINITLPSRPRKASMHDTKQCLKWWHEQLGCYALHRVTPALVAEYRDKFSLRMNKQGKPLAAQTIKHYLNSLSSLMAACEKEYFWIDHNPVRQVLKPAIKNNRVQFLSDAERASLLEACRASQSQHLYDIVVLALSTGMRQGEILKLRWQDVDLKRGRITLHETKNGEERVVPLTGHALERLSCKVRLLHNDHVFPGDTDSGHAEVRQYRGHSDDR